MNVITTTATNFYNHTWAVFNPGVQATPQDRARTHCICLQAVKNWLRQEEGRRRIQGLVQTFFRPANMNNQFILRWVHEYQMENRPYLQDPACLPIFRHYAVIDPDLADAFEGMPGLGL